VAVAVLPIRGRSDRCASASLTACPATDSRLMTATGARDTCTCAGAAGPLASCGPRTAAAATAADPAKAIAKILAKVLTRVGFDRLVERGGIKRALDRWSYDASGILAKVVYYAIMLFVLSTAFGVFGSNPISDYLRAVIAYLPLVFVAIVIVVIAAAIAAGARNLIENSLGGLSYARVLANLASGFILAIGVIAALDQLHIAAAVVDAILYAVLAALVGRKTAATDPERIPPMPTTPWAGARRRDSYRGRW
jgi:histone H3/H4